MADDTSAATRTAHVRVRPGWLALGVALGFVVAPAVAVAATLSVVNVAGPNGTRALVTRAGQLLGAPGDANGYRVFHQYGVQGGTCRRVYTAPHGVSMIVTQITINVFENPTPGSGNQVGVTTDPNCLNLMLNWNAPSIGAQVFPLGPGVVVPAGHGLFAVAYNGVDAEIYGYGYTVPFVDAPTPTPARSSGTRSNQAPR